jgi:hypothetical protein
MSVTELRNLGAAYRTLFVHETALRVKIHDIKYCHTFFSHQFQKKNSHIQKNIPSQCVRL